MQTLRKVLSAVAGLAMFAFLVVVYNLQFAAFVGDPRIPRLENRWWSGYFLTNSSDTVWSLARFEEPRGEQLRMALITNFGQPLVFNVERNSSGRTFVELEMTTLSGDVAISAKQLYEGKRYHFGRLMVGRWSDFWRKNDDISIRGQMAAGGATAPFEIEPIAEARLLTYYNSYVAPGSERSAESILSEALTALLPE